MQTMCTLAGVRMFFTVIFGLLVGAIYWRLGNDRCALAVYSTRNA